MRVLYSWAQRDPGDWLEVDAAQFGTLPDRGVPPAGAQGNRNNTPGWLSNVMCQGVMFNGQDHVAVEALTVAGEDACRITAWNDDPDDYPVGQRVARVWTFLPLAPDPTFGSGDRNRLLDGIRNEPGITEERRAEVLAWHNDPAHYPINTRQSQVVYAEGARYDRLIAAPSQNTIVLPWAAFVLPDSAITRHGVWVPDAHWEAQVAARTTTGWEHWCDHLPESEWAWETEVVHNQVTRVLPAPRRVLKSQRDQGRYAKATHTITYYQRDVSETIGYGAYTHENNLNTVTGTSATQSVTVNNGSGVNAWSFTTSSGQPNVADWPSGVFHSQININALSAGASIAGPANAADTSYLGLVRTDSTKATLLEELAGGGNFYATTGLHLATSGTIDFAAGASTDRFSVTYNATGDSHGDVVTLTLNTSDSYADGPWGGAVISNVTATPAGVGKLTPSLVGIFQISA